MGRIRLVSLQRCYNQHSEVCGWAFKDLQNKLNSINIYRVLTVQRTLWKCIFHFPASLPTLFIILPILLINTSRLLLFQLKVLCTFPALRMNTVSLTQHSAFCCSLTVPIRTSRGQGSILSLCPQLDLLHIIPSTYTEWLILNYSIRMLFLCFIT